MIHALSGNRALEFTIVVGLAVLAWAVGWMLNDRDLFSPGASSIALFGGIAVSLTTGRDFIAARAVMRVVLPLAIVLLGFGLDLSETRAVEIGATGIVAISVTCLMSFGIALLSARWLKVPLPIALTLGAGGAICGNAAVLAVAPLVWLKHQEIAVVLAAINLLGLALFFIIVSASSVLGLDPTAAGIWAGAAIHAVPQAIAAGEAIGQEGLAVATGVKLSRVSLLVVLVPLFGLVGRGIGGDHDGKAPPNNRRGGLGVPLFVPGFILAVVVSNMLLSSPTGQDLGQGGRLALLPVLAAAGLGVARSSLMQAGSRILFIGVLSTIGLASASLIVVLAMYN